MLFRSEGSCSLFIKLAGDHNQHLVLPEERACADWLKLASPNAIVGEHAHESEDPKPQVFEENKPPKYTKRQVELELASSPDKIVERYAAACHNVYDVRLEASDEYLMICETSALLKRDDIREFLYEAIREGGDAYVHRVCEVPALRGRSNWWTRDTLETAFGMYRELRENKWKSPEKVELRTLLDWYPTFHRLVTKHKSTVFEINCPDLQPLDEQKEICAQFGGVLEGTKIGRAHV